MKLIKLREVIERTSRPRTRIYLDIKAGTFPAPVKIGPRGIAWVENEIDAWIAARIADRDGEAA